LARLPTLATSPAELLDGSCWEGGVRHKRRYTCSTRLAQHAAALVERAARAREVVHHQHVVALAIALGDADDAAVAVPDLAASDDGEANLQERLPEALGGPVVREGDGCDRLDVRTLLGPQRPQEQRHGRVQRGYGVPVEVELVLQRVQVVNHHARGAAAGGQV